MAKLAPARARARLIGLATCSMSYGISGIRITSRRPRDAGVQRDPAGVAAHHLDDHDAAGATSAVVCSRSMHSVANDDRGVEAERR